MATGRLGATHPLEAGLNPPSPYGEAQYVVGALTYVATEVGDESKGSIEVNSEGDPIARPAETPVTHL